MQGESDSGNSQATNLGEYVRKSKLEPLTSDGNAYVEKVLHPPGSVPRYNGVPDTGSANYVPLQLTAETDFAPVLTVATSATDTVKLNPSSMLFLQTSGVKAATYLFFRYADGWVQPQSQNAAAGSSPSINQDTVPASIFRGYHFDNWVYDVGRTRTTYKSSTYYLNATSFNNQGTVATAKFKPNTIVGMTLVSYARSLNEENLETFLAALPNHAFISGDDYIVVEKSARSRSKDKAPPPSRTIAALNPDAQIQLLDMPSRNAQVNPMPFISNSWDYIKGVLPEDVGAIMQMSSKSVMRPASEGAFVVQQPIEDIQPWISTPANTDSTIAPGGGDRGLLLSFIRSTNGSAHVYFPLFAQNFSTSGFTDPLDGVYDTPWNNLDWCFVLFQGLTVPSPTTTALSNIPYISVKSYVGVELEPNLNGSLLPFNRTRPLHDRKAIEIANGIFHQRPDSLPASANDFGSFFKSLAGMVPVVGPWISKILGPTTRAAPLPPPRAPTAPIVKQKVKNKPKKTKTAIPPPVPPRRAPVQHQAPQRAPPPVPPRRAPPVSQMSRSMAHMTVNRR